MRQKGGIRQRVCSLMKKNTHYLRIERLNLKYMAVRILRVQRPTGTWGGRATQDAVAETHKSGESLVVIARDGRSDHHLKFLRTQKKTPTTKSYRGL